MEKVIIIGAGPAGTASAMNLLQCGLQPVIVEQEAFPRFHVGESLSVECVNALNRLGLEEVFNKINAPLKKGARAFSKNSQSNFYVGAGTARQVERSKLDAMMLETSIERGAGHIQGRAKKLCFENDIWQLDIELPDKEILSLKSRFVIDASGQKRFAQRQGLLAPEQASGYERQIALFSQFKGIKKNPEDQNDTLLFHGDKHEWCWLIPISDEVTSIGTVLLVEDFKKMTGSTADFFDSRLAEFSVPLEERIATAERIGKVGAISNYSYKLNGYANRGLICVGDSHCFLDPILSFGVQFAVQEAELAAKTIQACSTDKVPRWNAHFQEYMAITSAALNVIDDMLRYFWKYPLGYSRIVHIRHKDEFREIFAGRFYAMEAGPGLQSMRTSLA